MLIRCLYINWYGVVMENQKKKTTEEQIEELRQKLLNSDDLFYVDENGMLKEFSETETKPFSNKRDLLCDKCNEPLIRSSYEDEIFVKCPKCEYIQYVSSFKQISHCEWKVVDENGNDILDYTGNCRVFDNKDVADKYIDFC